MTVSSGEDLEGKDRFRPVAGNSEGGERREAERSVQLVATSQQGTMKNLAWGSGQGKGKEGQSEELGAQGLGLGGHSHGTMVRSVTHQGRRAPAGRWVRSAPLELLCVRSSRTDWSKRVGTGTCS